MADEERSALDEFFKTVTRIQSGIRQIETLTEDIKAKHSEALLNTDVEHGKTISAELDRLMGDVTHTSQDVTQGLKFIESRLENFEEKDASPAEYRIQQNQHQQLTHQFFDAMRAYQEAADVYSNKYKEQVKRRIKARYSSSDGRNLTDEEVDNYARQLLEEGKEDAIFQQSRDTLEQIQENHRDILRIEASVRELNQMFADMALLVDEQGELMDDIQYNVERSIAYVERGRQELRSARKHAKKGRRRICCVVCVLVTLSICILIPVYFATKGFGGGD
eukprot:TRINITY_DN66668_c7_g1_i1.p1 TRINITY_DN66668_c7_g1~~TRINITY_DN66668_c7_g1_i1.p1  ORF type:complete len:278 (+),score=35.64 TRINITY_DN66668_c7_g1_i1:59-892(+)